MCRAALAERKMLFARYLLPIVYELSLLPFFSAHGCFRFERLVDKSLFSKIISRGPIGWWIRRSFAYQGGCR